MLYKYARCSHLTSITNLASTPQTITSSTFDVKDTLHVLPGCGDAYRAADDWKDFKVILEDAVEQTDLKRVENEESVSPYYSIDGRSVAMPASPGIYIRNKKKLLIR